MRTPKLLLILLICAAPACADSAYDESGAVTIVGNDVCGGTPCIESLAFSFRMDYQLFGGLFHAHVLPGFKINPVSAGDEIDVNGPFGDAEAPAAPFPNLLDADLYGCGTIEKALCSSHRPRYLR